MVYVRIVKCHLTFAEIETIYLQNDVHTIMYIYIYITPTIVGIYRDWPGPSASNLYI